MFAEGYRALQLWRYGDDDYKNFNSNSCLEKL